MDDKKDNNNPSSHMIPLKDFDEDKDNIVPFPSRKHINHCALVNWYPLFSSLSIKTTFIPLTEEVIAYLLQDKIVVKDTGNSSSSSSGIHYGKNDDGDDDEIKWNDEDEDDEEELSKDIASFQQKIQVSIHKPPRPCNL